jgi:hypothetical protein
MMRTATASGAVWLLAAVAACQPPPVSDLPDDAGSPDQPTGDPSKPARGGPVAADACGLAADQPERALGDLLGAVVDAGAKYASWHKVDDQAHWRSRSA